MATLKAYGCMDEFMTKDLRNINRIV
ncbi:Protein of unknown function (plasmid) [Magnetospira sp. QH-2]|nr:Protein of unknown function [Magnetospira sp. QH-2]